MNDFIVCIRAMFLSFHEQIIFFILIQEKYQPQFSFLSETVYPKGDQYMDTHCEQKSLTSHLLALYLRIKRCQLPGIFQRKPNITMFGQSMKSRKFLLFSLKILEEKFCFKN